MRLPHWLRCHYSRWTTYEEHFDTLQVSNRVEVRQWRECMTCGKRHDRHVKDGPLGPAVPRAASARS